jgi:phage terminase large subunit|tara:strand:- start:3608 stop:4930 length:1323 start_codon:yes stop_codon:yes gene_type:complete
LANVSLPYEPRPLQAEFHQARKRFTVAVCHRRFGKTVMAVADAVQTGLWTPLHRPQVAYIAPTYGQAKRAAWEYAKEMCAGFGGVRFHESELRIDMPRVLQNGQKDFVRLMLLGADNPDTLRGIYLDHVVLDEYADMNPRLFPEVVRPALSDRKGSAVWIGTPRGQNLFYDKFEEAKTEVRAKNKDWYWCVHKASETGVVDEYELADAAKQMSKPQYAQEYECSFDAALEDAYYGSQMEEAELEGRIGRVPFDPNAKVETFFDLGFADATSIWFAQRVGGAVHLIAYYENSGEGLPHYVSLLEEYARSKENGGRGYTYSRHIFPHDVKVHEIGTGKSRLEVLEELGVVPDIAPNLKRADGIEQVRNLLPRCWFDEEKCDQGIKALKQYRKQWDETRKIYKNRPRHDWTSHAADALRYGAIVTPRSARWADPIEYPKRAFV